MHCHPWPTCYAEPVSGEVGWHEQNWKEIKSPCREHCGIFSCRPIAGVTIPTVVEKERLTVGTMILVHDRAISNSSLVGPWWSGCKNARMISIHGSKYADFRMSQDRNLQEGVAVWIALNYQKKALESPPKARLVAGISIPRHILQLSGNQCVRNTEWSLWIMVMTLTEMPLLLFLSRLIAAVSSMHAKHLQSS